MFTQPCASLRSIRDWIRASVVASVAMGGAFQIWGVGGLGWG
jgi:hypothetical protein